MSTDHDRYLDRQPSGPRRPQDPIQVLASVSCATVKFCMAVGLSALSNSDPGHAAVAWRWDGSSWMPFPPPPATTLDNVVCVSESFCIAVGANGSSGVLLRWDGKAWNTEQSPLSGAYYTVNCASENLCMALARPNPNGPLATVPVAVRWHGRWYKVSGYPAPAEVLSGVSCYSDTGCMVVGWARATPSAAATDIAGAQASAAFYDLAGGGQAAPPTTRKPTTPAPAQAKAGAGSTNHVTITGAVTATLTSKPDCSVLGSVHTIQQKGTDSTGAEVIATMTDGKNGIAQVLRGGSLFGFQGQGKVTVGATSVTLDGAVMTDIGPDQRGDVFVNGTITC